MAQAVDGLELSEGLWASENDAAESVRGEDEEEWKVEAFGFGLSPVAKALVEGLLIGREVIDGFGSGTGRAKVSEGEDVASGLLKVNCRGFVPRPSTRFARSGFGRSGASLDWSGTLLRGTEGASERQIAMISAPYRSAFSGPIPETVRSSDRVIGTCDDKVSEDAVAEDDEGRFSGFGGFVFAPGAEICFQGLLIGGVGCRGLVDARL